MGKQKDNAPFFSQAAKWQKSQALQRRRKIEKMTNHENEAKIWEP
jgi:hypothetical protein